MKIKNFILLLLITQFVNAQEHITNKSTKNFINNIEKSIKKQSVVKDIILTPEIFISLAPENEQEDLKNQKSEIAKMTDRWSEAASDFISGLSKYKNVKIISSEFWIRDSRNNTNSYEGNITFLCDETNLKYNLLALEANSQMYFKLIRKY